MLSGTAVDEHLYRFDIYICLADRYGIQVPPEKVLTVRNAIVDQFGGLTMTSTFGNPVYDGFWKSSTTRKVVRDKNSIFTVLAPQSEETRDYFLKKRKQWQRLLNYERLLITVHELQVL